jgi:phosphoenolpyruvate synthase/pyruvate phosphate dikinase
MKKTLLLILLSLSMVITSCNQQTITSYNNTIVKSHAILIRANEDFFTQSRAYFGKTESKKEFLQLIEETKSKIAEGRKPVEELVEFKDHGLRKTILEMYSNSQDSMDAFKASADMITSPGHETETAALLEREYSKLIELDQLIKELQVQYAYYNKTELR